MNDNEKVHWFENKVKKDAAAEIRTQISRFKPFVLANYVNSNYFFY